MAEPLVSLERFTQVDYSYHTYKWEVIFRTPRPKEVDSSGTLFSTLDDPTWVFVFVSVVLVFLALMATSCVGMCVVRFASPLGAEDLGAEESSFAA